MNKHSVWHELTPPFSILAPMEDVTDTVFRRLVSMWGSPDVFFTEFVNVDGMRSPGREAVIHRLEFSDIERPIVAQIWGLRPENFEAAARDIRDMKFDGIDINMGCPVKKIVKTGACSALIENQSLAHEIIEATQEGASDLPVSVKTRIGFNERKTIEWTGFLLEHNLTALTVHGRISKEMSDVPADWDEVGRVVTLRDRIAPATLIIGNGDVENLSQAVDYHKRYGVDGVMIGRGIFHNPLLFRKDGADFEHLTVTQKLGLLREHLTLYRTTWGERRNFDVLKKFVKVYVRGFNGASRLRNTLMETAGYDEMLQVIAEMESRAAVISMKRVHAKPAEDARGS